MRVFTLALILCIIWPTMALGQSIGALRDELNRIERKSVTLTAKIESARTKSNSIRNQADLSEKAVRKANARLDELEKELKLQQQDSAHIDEELTALNQQFSNARDELTNLIIAQFKQQSNSELRQWMGSESLAESQQIALWNSVVNESLQNRIAVIVADIDKSQKISATLALSNKKINSELSNIAQQRDIFNDKLKTNLNELNQIQSTITLNQAQLNRLQENKSRLVKLIDKLAQEQAERQKAQNVSERRTASTENPRGTHEDSVKEFTRVYNLPSGSFKNARGKMGLPVAGRIITNYAQKNPATGIKSDGISLKTAKGAKVNAIFGGKIVYAGFFKGFGQMVVIDHQGEYMSLYTLDGNLAVVEGQNVKTGETIGTTSSNNENSVYFEIRRGKVTEDPLKWCRRDAVAAQQL